MRQKFVISIDDTIRKLKISEYAIIEKHLKSIATALLQKKDYSFLCEETYEIDIIKDSIASGMNTLVATLRTNNFFPIKSYAIKIAESVMALFNASDDNSVELFFDDVTLVSQE